VTRKLCNAMRRERAGFSLLELSVGLTVLAFAIVGLMRMTVSASRQLAVVEARYPETSVLYVKPNPSAWAQRLGVAATVSGDASLGTLQPVSTNASVIQIVAFTHDVSSGRVTLDVTAREPNP
jgi:prepilin-type N-terminal cleavage/methylation domain-containing protein